MLRNEATWRDIFPKHDLDAGYIGDRYPLCNHLPQRHYLRKGARYRYLGGKSSFVPSCDSDGGCVRLQADPAGTLHAHLCAKQSGVCTFPMEVVLPATAACVGQECDVETVHVVQLNITGKATFYEYVPPACVYLSFFNQALSVA